MRRSIYLDHASGTPVDKRVLGAMEPYWLGKFYNPAAYYSPGVEVKTALHAAKKTIASLLGVVPSELIITSGGTESNNLAIDGIMSQYPDKKLIISNIEHESVLMPAKKYIHELIKVDKTGVINSDKLKISDDVVLISVMLVNNELGTIQPIKKIAEIISDTKRNRREKGNKLPLIFHTDAAQAPLYLDIHAHRLGVDMMTINGGKIYGPKQSGLLYVSSKVSLLPQILGGGQQRGMRSGSENTANVVGLAKSMEIAGKMRNSEIKRLSEIQKYFISEIKKFGSKAQINGHLKKRAPNNAHITFFGQDNERLLYKLDEVGILVATGSACSASSDEPSHVLRAIGLTEKDARSSLRFTMGRATTKKDIDYTISALRTFVQ